MAASTCCSSSVPSLPTPCPKSPPEYPDLYGKRRELAKVQMMEREIGFLEDELKTVEGIQPASRCCKEVYDFVVANPDPLIPTNRKIRRLFRFWKWICGKSCFNLSWICCSSRCSLHVKMPSCCGSCNPSEKWRCWRWPCCLCFSCCPCPCPCPSPCPCPCPCPRPRPCPSPCSCPSSCPSSCPCPCPCPRLCSCPCPRSSPCPCPSSLPCPCLCRCCCRCRCRCCCHCLEKLSCRNCCILPVPSCSDFPCSRCTCSCSNCTDVFLCSNCSSCTKICYNPCYPCY